MMKAFRHPGCRRCVTWKSGWPGLIVAVLERTGFSDGNKMGNDPVKDDSKKNARIVRAIIERGEFDCPARFMIARTILSFFLLS